MKKHAIVTDRAPAPRDRPTTAAPPLLGATFEGAAVVRAQLPGDGAAEVAFAGRSNSGKSSAINALARHRGLARASRTPGRTRELNLFRLRSGARVVDLPGYGYAAVSKDLKRAWQDFLWDYILTRATLVGLVLVVDARHGVRPLDQQLIEAFGACSRPILVLATKADKLGHQARRDAVNAIHAALEAMRATNAVVVSFSAVSGEGVDQADAIVAGWLPLQPREAESAQRMPAADRKRPRDQGE